MPEYKLIYFNGQGRGETIRWIFAQGGIEYTDERIEMADWPERKPGIPGGKMPVLIVDGKTLVQSFAIARFMAKEAGLVPDDNLEAAYCDALVDTLSEMLMKYLEAIMKGMEDEDEMNRLLEEEFFPNSFEPIMRRLDGRLSEREWFITDDLTWADLVIGRCLNQILAAKPDALESFPALAAHVDKVCELPAIKEWIENRPETPF